MPSHNQTIYFVSAENLIFRKTPDKNGEIITELHHGTKVTLNESFKPSSYIQVRVIPDGEKEEYEGYLHSRYLRKSESSKIEKLIHEATKEWKFFKRGVGKEHKNPYSEHIGKMWSSLGISYVGTNRNQPWSAAFISWVLKNSGYDRTKLSDAHSVYINEAIKNRFDENQASDFWCYDLDKKPEVGDIVCMWREGEITSHPITYAYAKEHEKFSSHTDIVIAVRDNEIIILGGNVNHSVETKRFSLDENGLLIGNADNRLFAIMKNQHR